MVAAKSSGVPPPGSSPILANFSLKASEVSALLMAALILSTIGRGTPAGAMTPVQVGARYPGTPASAMVGKSGNAGERLVVVREGRHRLQAFEHEIDMAGYQIADGRRATAVRNVHNFRSGHVFEQFAANMAG